MVIIAIIAVLLKVTGVLDAGTSSFSSSSGGGGSSKKTWRIYATEELEFAKYYGPTRVENGETAIVRIEANEGYPFLYPDDTKRDYPLFDVTYGTTVELIDEPTVTDRYEQKLVYRISNITGDVTISRHIIDLDVMYGVRFSSDVSAVGRYRNGTATTFDNYVVRETNLSGFSYNPVCSGDTFIKTFTVKSGYRFIWYGVFPDEAQDIDTHRSYSYDCLDLGNGRYKINVYNVDRPLVIAVSAERIDDES